MPREPARQPGPDPAAHTADRLHSIAIHLLRRLRKQDDQAGLSAPYLSALSVIVFGGPVTIGDLAAAEQVRAPTISRMIRKMVQDGLVLRNADPDDRRVVRVRATEQGMRILRQGRQRRVETLAAQLRSLDASERSTLERAATILEALLREGADR